MSVARRTPRLAWKAHLHTVIVPPDYLVVLSEDRQLLFRGPAYVHAASLLVDGCWSEDEIPAQLEDRGVPAATAWLAIAYLRALGLLRETEPDPVHRPRDEETMYWNAIGEEVVAVAARLARTRVFLKEAGGTGVAELRRALQSAGVVLTDTPRPTDFTVVVADDFLDFRLDAVNREAIVGGTAWMTVKLSGTVPWIGPLYVPGQTGCWECLAQRLRLNQQTEQFVEARLGPAARAPLPTTQNSLMLAADFAACEVLQWLATERHDRLHGALFSLDLKTNTLQRHLLMRRPQCSACGARPQQHVSHTSFTGPLPELGPSPKSDSSGGRSESVRRTLARLEHHVSPITGAVRALQESRENGYLHVAAAQAFPMYRYDFKVLRDNLLGRSGGKGFDLVQARVSALCEALERYSGIWQGEEEVMLTGVPRRELGDCALDPDTLLGFSRRQYAERETWNMANVEPHAWVPRPFDDDMPVDWVPLSSLSGGGIRLAPAAYCYYGHPDLSHMFCASDSNGCAAGGTLSEALAHGLLELIERDAVAIWWYNRLIMPGLDLDSFASPLVAELRAIFHGQRRDFWTLDLTTDLGVPVIAAISARLDGPVEDIIYGFGADLDPCVAVTKALLEMNQSLFSVLNANSRAVRSYRTDRPEARRWFQSATRANQQYLLPDPNQGARSLESLIGSPHTDWCEDIQDMVARLQQAGLEPFVLDQTRADIGLPVCRVVVPGLCHFWRRFGSARLYDVPVRLNWLSSPTPEAELNPWFIYF